MFIHLHCICVFCITEEILCFQSEKKQDGYLSRDFYLITLPREHYAQLHFHFHTLEKEMATHSSVLAWRIPGTGKPGGLPSMGIGSIMNKLIRFENYSQGFLFNMADRAFTSTLQSSKVPLKLSKRYVYYYATVSVPSMAQKY